jgi:hypothetical protein
MTIARLSEVIKKAYLLTAVKEKIEFPIIPSEYE